MQDNDDRRALRVLEVTASGRYDRSASRALAGDLIAALEQRHGKIELTRRDVARGLPFIDADWIGATFEAPARRTVTQRRALETSDELVAELENTEVLVIAVPMYNFGVPATLKAWIDLIARAGVTFRYTENGPEGLLRGKRAYIVVSTGGVTLGSEADFVSPYLRRFLGFVGIDEVTFVAAEALQGGAETSMDAARQQISELVHSVSQERRKVA